MVGTMKKKETVPQRALGPWLRAALVIFILLLLAYGAAAFLLGKERFRATPSFTAPEAVVLPERQAGR